MTGGPGRGARGGPHCTSTGELSHRGMFLNRASIRRHIAATKPCREANMCIREILLEARAGNVMAGGGVLRGPRRTSDISQQVTCRPKSETVYLYHAEPYLNINTRGLVV